MIEVLTRKPLKEQIAVSGCFDPHHAIFIFKEGQISYLDICFTCRGLVVSDDISVSYEDFDQKKWEELHEFIQQLGLTYEL